MNFSQDDINKLNQAPFLIFFLVSAADGKIDKKEVVEFSKMLGRPEVLQNPHLRSIIQNVQDKVPEILMDMLTRKLNYIAELEALRAIAEKNLSADEANNFKIALFLLGKTIAEASGGLFSFGSKISKDEKAALTAVALCLGIKA